MRALAAMTGAALLLAAPAEAPAKRAKPVKFAAKSTAAAKRVAARGWRAKPKATPAAPVGAPAPLEAPVQPAGADTPPGEQPAVVAPPPAPAAPACDPSPWLGVIAEDAGGFRFRLTRTCVPAGTVLFQFRNTDLADHNLWAEGVAPVAPPRRVVGDTPGETVVTARATLGAGRWRLYCSFDGHEAMSRLVDVTPAG